MKKRNYCLFSYIEKVSYLKKNWRKSRRLFLISVATGSMLNPLNSSMIALALSSIQRDFGLSFTSVSWLISSFYLASAVAQPVAGKLGDVIGRKKMFLGGLVLVFISALGAPFTPTFSLLIVMRLIQAVGSGAVSPSGTAMVRDHISKDRASALAFIAIFMSTMAALGPTIGGFLITLGDWHAIFLINLPIIVISFLLGWFVLPKDPSKEKLKLKEIVHRVDMVGILLFSGGVISLLLFLLSFENKVLYGAGIIGIIFLYLFGRHELKAKIPFIDIRLFKTNRKLSLVYIQFLILNFINYCLFFGLPSYFQDGLHLSVNFSGILMLFVTGTGVILSPFVGRWIDKAGVNKPIIFGNSLLVLGAVLLIIFFKHVPIIAMGFIVSIIGMGCSFGNVTLQTAMLEESPRQLVGTTTGLFQMCRHFGSILSTIALGIVFGDHFIPKNFTTLVITLLVAGLVMVLLGIRYVKVKSVTMVN